MMSATPPLRLPRFRMLAVAALIAGLSATQVTAATPTPTGPTGDYDICIGDTDDRAIAACTRAIARDHYRGAELAMLHVSRSVGYLLAGDADAAIADADAALQSDPADAVAFWSRGSAWQNKNEPARAIADFSEAIRLDPEDASSLIQRGIAREAIGDIAGSARDIAEATRIDPVLTARKYIRK
ncbi:tetratricopeptide repeat protein [Tardiphaga sp. 862_B3_N4_1]|jgi:tetratricopeptide (TPR) repeat protein|uniref:tetratricopeptide repeat protein n=1 Tax=Tardiphaga sp. 862_B3_N4_1 TaxID=3240764 RepID=UPI003F2978CF